MMEQTDKVAEDVMHTQKKKRNKNILMGQKTFY